MDGVGKAPGDLDKLLSTFGDVVNRTASLVDQLVTSTDKQAWLRAHPELWELLDRMNELERAVFRVGLTGRPTGGAKDRLLAYMRERMGQPISRSELSRAAGISEWARRLRELRIEEGWPIDTLDAGKTYRLGGTEPDKKRAKDWTILHDVRQARGGVRSKVLKLLQLRMGQVVPRDDLVYVAGEREFARRIRELDERGWHILSERQLPTLRGGSYMLVSNERDDRPYRVPIPRRDHYLTAHPRCARCGAAAGQDGRWLEVDHKQAVSKHAKGGPDPNRDENLQTLCNRCHVGKTAAERK